MNETSPQQYQQMLINLYYISDNITVNNTRSFTQKLLHPTENNQNLSLKEPSQLRVITKLTYQSEIKYIFVIKIIFLIGSSDKSYFPFGTDKKFPLQYFIKMILILYRILDKSRISPNFE